MLIQLMERKSHENNREYAYRVLRHNIMNFVLEPGMSLNENELSQMFGMSRTPIHEAIIELRNEHLVDVQPQLVSRISLIDLELLREGHYIRLCIEPDVIRNIAGTVAPRDLHKLEEILEQQIAALESNDLMSHFFPLDDLFHQKLYELNRMPHIWSCIKSISSHFDRVRYLDASYYDLDKEDHKKEYIRTFYGEHMRIYELLMCGISKDFDVRDYLENHMSSYKKTLMHIIKKHPHYFLDFRQTAASPHS